MFEKRTEWPLGISHETIYQFIYSKDGQENQLGKLLSLRQKKRRPRYTRKSRGVIFPEAVSIRNRPDIINQREEFDHWEGDLMIFQRDHGKANVATIIERISRNTVLFKNNDKRSKPLMNKLVTLLSSLPFEARQSITFDRGFEFSSWRDLIKVWARKHGSVIHPCLGRKAVSRT